MIIDAEVEKASKNAQSLLDLHDKDPKLANEVAKKFGYSDFEDAKSRIPSKKETILEKKNIDFNEDEFEKMYQKRKKKEEHEKAISKVEKEFNKLDKSVQEKAKAYFEKITE